MQNLVLQMEKLLDTERDQIVSRNYRSNEIVQPLFHVERLNFK